MHVNVQIYTVHAVTFIFFTRSNRDTGLQGTNTFSPKTHEASFAAGCLEAGQVYLSAWSIKTSNATWTSLYQYKNYLKKEKDRIKYFVFRAKVNQETDWKIIPYCLFYILIIYMFKCLIIDMPNQY